jgi:hypothetical protein
MVQRRVWPCGRWCSARPLSLRKSGTVDLLFGGSRVLHVAAVLAACVLMFGPSANAYVRTPARLSVRAAGREDSA